MSFIKGILIWAALLAVIVMPIVVAAGSPYLQYRSAVYITAGFAGIVALALLLLQPLLAAGQLPGLPIRAGRQLHRWTGAALMFAVALHVAGLWVTSPPDMIDALTFTAPTAFSALGVVAMWALVLAALLAGFRRRLRFRPQVWRLAHTIAALAVVAGSVAHALMLEGTMGIASKTALCAAVVGALLLAVRRLQPWAGVSRVQKTRAKE